MNKKIMVVALALMATTLITTNVFAQAACSSGVTIQFNAVGSSAQANSFALAAKAITGYGTSPFYNLVSTKKGAVITDKRPASGAVTDSANPFWVMWDNNAVCNVYAYWTIDSGAGVKDFFAYEKFTNGSAKVYTSLAAAYGTLTDSSFAGNENQVGGLPDTQDSQVGVAGSAFEAIEAVLNTTPETRVATGNVQAPAYCGNTTTTSTAALSQYQCYFNVGATDIRPEDALYATTRALTTYSGYSIAVSSTGTSNVITKVGTGELTGLGYNTANNGGTCTPSTAVGCTIVDSFDQGKTFNVVNFKLSGTDPLAGGSLPAYTTLATGAEPVLVIVHNGSVFGETSSGTYTYHNINKQVLAQVFSGQTHCTGDLLTSSAAGHGDPIQVVEREPLSGTYNTFEFTAVRTLAGSANPLFAPTGTGTSLPPASNAYIGQEEFNDPNALPGGNGTACSITGGFPQANCFNPLFLENPINECTESGFLPVRLRAIGTGEEVKATVATYTSGAGNAAVDNSIGYSFWGYGNLDPLCSATGGTSSCPGSYIGHYLTVDSIDPLFTTPGGALDSTPNPAGAYNPPYCNVTGTSNTCFAIPFTHILDGSYPLWSMLRLVTFAPVSGKTKTPIPVLNMVAEAETTTATDGLSDFVPFLNTLSGSLTTGVWTGNLNIFAFRSHYTQSAIKPANGHTGCAGVFTGISLQGGSVGHSTCLVDFGGDVGGSVLTVQGDVDYLSDWSVEEYGTHQ
ncbi:MAG: hypothetical protein ABSA78_04320 [Candidatus Sulfotelmatobacter sp.]|jgi:hypothetical protein